MTKFLNFLSKASILTLRLAEQEKMRLNSRIFRLQIRNDLFLCFFDRFGGFAERRSHLRVGISRVFL